MIATISSSRVLSRDELVEALRRMRSTLAALGITRLALIGSRARGDNRADSDVDVIVDVAAGRKFSLLDLVAVEQALEDQVGLPANAFMRRSLDKSFAEGTRRDEVTVFDAP